MFSGTNNILYTFPNILFVLFYFLLLSQECKLCKAIEFYLYTSLVGTQEVYLNEGMNEPKIQSNGLNRKTLGINFLVPGI